MSEERRADLTGADKAVSEVLDEINFRMHGLISGGSYHREFRQWLSDRGYVVGGPGDAAAPAPITAEDVRAAEQAWNGLTIREAGGWDVHEDAKAAFIADHLNGARDHAPDPGAGRDETTEGNG